MTVSRYAVAATAFAVTLCLTVPVEAQTFRSFRLDRYQVPASLDDGIALQTPSTLGHLRFSGALTLDYNLRPLFAGTNPMTGRDLHIVRHQLAAHVALALGVTDYLQFSVSMPIVIHQRGDSSSGSGRIFFEPTAGGAGDLSLGASARLVGDPDDGASLGVTAAVSLPTGSTDALNSDDTVGVRGTLSFAWTGPVVIAAEAGGAFRKERRHGLRDFGSRLLFRAGVHVPLLDQRLRLMAELDGDFDFGRASNDAPVALEAHVGARYATPSGVQVGAAIAAGLTSAPTEPDLRTTLTIGYATPQDRDQDGDGILDDDDACAEEPEDFDEFEDEDGCPEADNDADGVLDEADECPLQPETANGFEDEDGCPEADSDSDGLVDGMDTCPREPETRNGFEDEDGCPDTPPEPEVEPEIEPEIAPEPLPRRLVDPVLFRVSRARLTRRARRRLRELVVLLQESPDQRVVVIGHASEDGSEEYNQELSERRAEAVARWLRRHGIDSSRVEVRGVGETQPDASNDSEDGRERNRRVELERP